jgi:hypothetical protein
MLTNRRLKQLISDLYLKCVPILFKLLRRILDPIGEIIYIFTYNPLILDGHYSVLYPRYIQKVRWSDDTPLFEGLTIFLKDFNYYPCQTPDFKTCIHKRHIIGLSFPRSAHFDIIPIEEYTAF